MPYTETDKAFYRSIGLSEPSDTPPDLFSPEGLREGDRVGTFFMVDTHGGTKTLGTPPNALTVSELPVSELLKG